MLCLMGIRLVFGTQSVNELIEKEVRKAKKIQTGEVFIKYIELEAV